MDSSFCADTSTTRILQVYFGPHFFNSSDDERVKAKAAFMRGISEWQGFPFEVEETHNGNEAHIFVTARQLADDVLAFYQPLQKSPEGWITKARIVFNNNETWSCKTVKRSQLLKLEDPSTESILYIDEETSGQGATDVQTISAHEYGHLLGLGHSNAQQSIMLPYTDEGEVRYVTLRDLNAVRNIYYPPPQGEPFSKRLKQAKSPSSGVSTVPQEE